MDEQILKDFVATAEKYNYDWNAVFNLFPELKSYDQQLLKDYTATAKKYNYDWSKANSYFPEFGVGQQQPSQQPEQQPVVQPTVKKKDDMESSWLFGDGSSESEPSKTEPETDLFGINQKVFGVKQPQQEQVEPIKRPETVEEASGTWGNRAKKEQPLSEPLSDYMQVYGQKKGEGVLAPTKPLDFVGRMTPELVKERTPKFLEDGLDALTPSQFWQFGAKGAKETFEYYFKDAGFKFEADGNNVKAISPSGEIYEYNTKLAAYPNNEMIDEFKNFVRESAFKNPQIADKAYLYEKENKKFKTKEDISNEVKTINSQEEQFNGDYKKFLNLKRDIDEIEADLKRFRDFGEQNTPKYIQTEAYLNERKKELQDYAGTMDNKAKGLEAQQTQLDKAVGKYTEFQATQGTFGGNLYRAVAETSSNIFSQFLRTAVSKSVDLMPLSSVMGEEVYQDALNKKLKEKGYEGNVVPIDVLKEAKAEVESEIGAKARNDFKVAARTGKYQGEQLNNVLTINDVRESLKETLTAPISTTSEYKQKREEEGSFIERGMIGLAGSLPAMIGGKYVRYMNMFMMTTDAVMQEMDNNPNFAEISENEKELVALPIGVVGAALEELGLKNLKLGKSITSSILKTVLGRVPANATASTIRKTTFDVLAERGIRAGTAYAGGILSEMETGLLQQVNDYAVKDIYDMMKGKDMFKNPAFLSGQYLYDVWDASRTEGVGAGVVSVPYSIAAAYQKDGFQALDDATFKIFEDLAKDDNGRKFFVTSLKNRINQGTVTPTQGKQMIEAYDQASGMIGTVADEITDTESRKVAMDLISERKKLEAKRDKTDPALAKPIQNKIDKINEQLTQLTEDAIQKQAASEVSLQPETEPSKEMEAGGPEAGPKITPEESKRKEALIEALEETKRQEEQTGKESNYTKVNGISNLKSAAQEELDAIIAKERTPVAEQGGMEQAPAKMTTTEALTSTPTETKAGVTFVAPDGNEVALEGNEQVAAQLYDDAVSVAEEQRTPEQNDIIQKMQPIVTAAAPAVQVTPAPKTTTDIITSAPIDIKGGVVVTDSNGNDVMVNGNEQVAAKLYDEAMATPEDQRTPEQNDIVEKVQRIISQVAAEVTPATETTPTATTAAVEVTPATEVTPVEQQFTEQDRARKAELEEAMRKADNRRKNITVGETTMPKAEAKAELAALKQKEQAAIDAEVEAIEKLVSAPEQKDKGKIRQIVENAVKAIARILPNTKVVIHETNEDYVNATGDTEGASGLYVPKPPLTKEESKRKKALIKALKDYVDVREDALILVGKSIGVWESETKKDAQAELDALMQKEDGGTIHINMSNANTRTAGHEVFHAILLRGIKTDAEAQRLAKAMIGAVAKSLKQSGANQELLNELENFLSNYDENIQNEEYLAEVFGYLADGYPQLDVPAQNIIKRFIDRIMQLFGLKPMTDKEVIDFMNTLSRKIAAGEEITEEEAGVTKKTKGISNITKRFQANFIDPISRLSFVYDKNSEKFENLKKQGFITTDKSLSDFNGKSIFLHQPDAAFSGMIYKNNELLVEGKGGVFYPIKFHEDGYFWASTSKTAKTMADQLNAVMQQNGGTIYMALTSAPYHKLMSSTTMSNAVLDFFASKAFDKNFKISEAQLKSSLIKAGNDVKIIKSKNKKGEIVEKRISLNLNLTSKMTIEEIKSAIKTALNPDVNVFDDRKNFALELTKLMANEINKNDVAVNQFGKLFSEGIQNKYFKGITKTGKLKISAANMTQALSEMFTEPMLKEGVDRDKGGQVYAILELNGAVEPFETKQHESYPMAIKSSSKSKVKVHVLTDRQNWYDVFEDPDTNEIVTKDRLLNVFPTSGVSNRGLKLNTSKVKGVSSRQQKVNKEVQGIEQLPAARKQKVKSEKSELSPRQQKSNNSQEIIKQARANGYSEESIRAYFKKNGLSDIEIDILFDEEKGGGKKPELSEKTFPGYTKLMNRINDIIERGRRNGKSYYDIMKAVIANVESRSPEYANASAQKQEQIIRDIRKMFGLKEKAAPSAAKILGKPKPKMVTVTVNDMTELKKRIKIEAKAAREGKKQVTDAVKEIVRLFNQSKVITALTRADLKKIINLMDKVYDDASLQKAVGEMFDIILKSNADLIEVSKTKLIEDFKRKVKAGIREGKKDLNTKRKELAAAIKKLADKGSITLRQAKTLINKVNSVNLDNPVMVERMLDYAEKVFNDAAYAEKLSQANKLQSDIKDLSKNKKKFGNLTAFAAEFAKIDPAMVENIDEYLEMASKVKEGVQGSKTVGETVIPADMVDVGATMEYVNKTMEAQEEAIRLKTAERLQELMGVDVSDLTYDQMMELLDTTTDKKVDKYKEGIIRGFIDRMFNTYSTIINDMFETGIDPFSDPNNPTTVDFKDSDKKIVEEFMAMDLSLLDAKEALRAADALNNFLTNKSTAGMLATLGDYNGRKNIKEVADKNIKAEQIKMYWSPVLGKAFFQQIASIPAFFDRLFKSYKTGRYIREMMGINSLINHKADAVTAANRVINNYILEFSKKKPNNKNFQDMSNVIERGIIGELAKTIVGDAKQVEAEFNRRKKLIEQSITRLEESGTKKETEMAKAMKEAYDKIAKDSKTIEEVKAKADQVNVDAVQFWVDQWAKLYDQFADVALNVYNRVLDKNVNYVPDRFGFLERAEKKKKDADGFESMFVANSNSEYFYKKEAGSLMKSTPPQSLLDEDGNSMDMYVNLSFDTNNANALMEALIDIKTAADIRQIQAFKNDSKFKYVFPFGKDAAAVKERIAALIRNIRNKRAITDKSFKEMVRKMDRIAAIGTSLLLAGPTQAISQTIPVAINTLINSGGKLNLSNIKNKDVNRFIDESGMGIANRGSDAVTELETLNQKLEVAAKTKAGATVQYIENLNRKYLKLYLSNFDVFIARASWLTYYEKGLRKQGIKGKVDYSTHKQNKEAAQYAQDMIDRQQNISDKDLAGQLYQSDNPVKQFIVKVVMPLATFRMNQTTRFSNDLAIFTSKTASTEEKKEAAISIGGFAAEMATFRAIKLYIGYYVFYSLAQMIRGEEDDEEEKQKTWDNMKRGAATSVVSDVFSPIPQTDVPTKILFAGVLDQLQNIAGVGEDDKFNIFTESKSSFTSDWGLLGVGVDKMIKLGEKVELARTGKFKDDFGNEKTISESDRALLSNPLYIGINVATVLGINPFAPETDNVMNRITKMAKKNAMSNEQLKEAEELGVEGKKELMKIKADKKAEKEEAYGGYETLKEFEEKEPEKFDEYSAPGGKLDKYREKERKVDEEKNKDEPFRGLSEKKFKELYPVEWAKNYGPGTAYFQKQNSPAMLQKKAQEKMREAQREQKRKMAEAKRKQQEILKKASGR